MAERDDLRVVDVRVASNDFASELMKLAISAMLGIFISIGASILVKWIQKYAHSKPDSPNRKHDYSERLSEHLK